MRDEDVWSTSGHRHPAEDRKVELGEKVIQRLKAPMLAAEKADELHFHRPPTMFGAVRATLLDRKRGMVILVGPPGIGKSLAGLRLVAELMQYDARIPLLPRISDSPWAVLNRYENERRIAFIDDAFGKTFVRRQEDLLDAKIALRRFVGLDRDGQDTLKRSLWVETAGGDYRPARHLEVCRRGMG